MFQGNLTFHFLSGRLHFPFDKFTPIKYSNHYFFHCNHFFFLLACLSLSFLSFQLNTSFIQSAFIFSYLFLSYYSLLTLLLCLSFKKKKKKKVCLINSFLSFFPNFLSLSSTQVFPVFPSFIFTLLFLFSLSYLLSFKSFICNGYTNFNLYFH